MCEISFCRRDGKREKDRERERKREKERERERSTRVFVLLSAFFKFAECFKAQIFKI